MTRLAALAVLLLAASQAFGAGLRIYTVNYPLAYFAERIGGDLAAVSFPAPDGVDPAFWKPGPDVVVDYQDADLILRNGAGYAKWTRHASLPRRTQVDTSRSFASAYLPGLEGVAHAHGLGQDHAHGGVAFTTWLDPRQALVQARAIEEALSKLRPDEANTFAARADDLETDLAALDRELAAAFGSLGDRSLLASHPVYPYLARRYALEMRSLLWEPDVTPPESEWRALDAILERHAVAWMLWEAEPGPDTRAGLRERGIGVIVFRTCANRPRDGDYLSVMRGNVEALRAAVSSGP